MIAEVCPVCGKPAIDESEWVLNSGDAVHFKDGRWVLIFCGYQNDHPLVFQARYRATLGVWETRLGAHFSDTEVLQIAPTPTFSMG